MTEFDVSGEVARTTPYTDIGVDPYWYWSDLTPFAKGYVEAMLQALGAVKESRAEGYYLFAGFSDLAPETLARIMEDCNQVEELSWWYLSDERRRELGARLWKWQQSGIMTDPAFQPLTIYLGDDGKVKFR